MEFDALILGYDERLCQLEDARVAAVEHLNCIRGGIAEVQYLRQQAIERKAAEETAIVDQPAAKVE